MAFRKPKKVKIGGKFLAMGMTNSGKSYFGLTFPKIGAIDSETGLAFYEDTDIEIGNKKYNNLELVDTTSDLDDLEDALDSIISGEYDNIESLLIDSETKFYLTMDIGATEVEEKKAKQKNKEVDTRAKWGRVRQINMKFQQAKITASAKGVHVVSIAQAKEIIDDNTKKLLGYAPETHKSLPFDYDVILRFYTEDDKNGNKRYFAEVIKDRTNVTKDGQIIENCTYDVWKSYFDKRNGLETSGANYSKDLKSSINSTLGEAELQEQLSKEIIEKIKSAGKENSAKIREKINALGLDIKDLSNQSVEDLKTLDKFLNTL